MIYDAMLYVHTTEEMKADSVVPSQFSVLQKEVRVISGPGT